MRTGRTLTVFRWRPPHENLENPPRKFGGTPLPGPDQTHTPPPGTRPDTPPVNRMNDRRLWKYYLGQNFVSAGNKLRLNLTTLFKLLHLGNVHCNIFSQSRKYDGSFWVSEHCPLRTSDVLFKFYWLSRQVTQQIFVAKPSCSWKPQLH